MNELLRKYLTLFVEGPDLTTEPFLTLLSPSLLKCFRSALPHLET